MQRGLEREKSLLQEKNQQFLQLFAEKEYLIKQMEQTLAAKDDAIAVMKQKTNEIQMQMQRRFTQISAELASATDYVNSKEGVIERLRAEMTQLKGDLEATQVQV